MLSRVADSLFWMSRYIERSDGILRMLKINYATSQDVLNDFTWRPVIKIFTGLNDNSLVELETNSREVLRYMLINKENHNSVLNIVTLARENARSVQDHINKDLWQCLNEYYHTIKDSSIERSLQKDDPVSVLDILIKQGMLYYGTTEITMERGEGRSFMSIGKYLERAIQSIDILDIKIGAVETSAGLLSDTSYLKHLLLSIGGYELYLKNYRKGIEAQSVVEQVVFNNDFPRSVLYAINQLYRYFDRLNNELSTNQNQKLLFMIGKLQSRVKYSSVDGIYEEGLHNYLSHLKKELFGVGNALGEHYFAYA
ncbi:alpha-E domain-containing protein [Solitalea sp. MAHUQ-68]|uniref:Alpha-E domain-containing protein n=1 Tax=Solitalea agri TaxID=2953739 RepID=A0A9X2F5A7_9SPHI|nr:alpha-E domain-containing protein [Solitalea agri]MCO4294395.1 alpha-E domain-containing protein [Solitalea agri]